MKKYKYIHIMWANELKFLANLVKQINRPENLLHPEQHLFVTPHKPVYDALSEYGNVILDTSGEHLINKYAPQCDWLFSHGMTNKTRTLKIKRKYLKKVVWRTWGGSRQKIPVEGNPIQRIKAWMTNTAYYLFMRHTFGNATVIGIANLGDQLDLEQWGWAKHTNLFKVPYCREDLSEIVKRVESKGLEKHSGLNVMVGHQGNSGEHHVALTKLLIRHDNPDMRIYLPLSYGDMDYIKKVKDELQALNDSRIIVMDEFMEFEKYIEFISSIDVALIDELSSMALGNLSYLIYFRKKIYLHPDGILRKAFDADGVPYELSDKLATQKYEELAKPLAYPKKLESSLVFSTYERGIQCWKDLLSFLDEKSL